MTTTVAAPAAETRPSGHLPGSSGYRRTLIALMFGGLANFALMYYVQPLLPELTRRYGVEPAQAAGAMSVSMLALAAGLLLAGPLADRFGRVPVLRWSLLVSGVVGVACAFAPTWEVLLSLRAIDGIALAGLPAVALAFLREEVDGAHHVQANAAYITGTALGGAVARLVPVPISDVGGWPLATATMGVLTLVAAGVVWIVLPPSAGFTPRAISLRRRLLGTAAAFSDPVVALLCLAGFVTMGVFVGIFNALGFVLAVTPLGLGSAVTLVYFAYVLGIPGPILLGRLSRRLGRGGAAGLGIGAVCGGACLLVLPAWPAVIVGLSLVTFGFLGAHSIMSGWIVDRAHRRETSTAQAASAYLVAYYLGSAAFGVAAVGVWQGSGWRAVIALSLLLGMTAAVAVAISAHMERRSLVS